MLAIPNKCLYNKNMNTNICTNVINEKRIEYMHGEVSTQEQLRILADAAKYDVACTSSGVDRKGKKGSLGNSVAAGVCHSFAADGRCISLLKVLFTNHCIYDCKYCQNRCSNDVERASFEPDELCKLVIEFYKRNYIEGLFLSSGVDKSPSYTMQQICDCLSLLRNRYHFNGYIHVKTIPGAPDELIALAGYLADRISVNLELPTEAGLSKLAPNKTFRTILEPMGQITDTIREHRLAIGQTAHMERSMVNQYLSGSIFSAQNRLEQEERLRLQTVERRGIVTVEKGDRKRPFAPAGQSTQMIIGATDETDLTILNTTQKLYQAYDLKRVFYSAYIPLNEDAALPAKDTPVPLLREHRLYQADWLLRYYGFQAGELLSEEKPFFHERLDPKCDWALRHLGDFPVEVQTASVETLLRVPGIGPKSATRIVQARRLGSLNFDTLKRIGVVLKRAHYFLTCNGRMMYHIPFEETYITRQLCDMNSKENWQIAHQNEQYTQMSLFSDFYLGNEPVERAGGAG